jgi:hypothetical protein
MVLDMVRGVEAGIVPGHVSGESFLASAPLKPHALFPEPEWHGRNLILDGSAQHHTGDGTTGAKSRFLALAGTLPKFVPRRATTLSRMTSFTGQRVRAPFCHGGAVWPFAGEAARNHESADPPVRRHLKSSAA